MIKYPRTPHLEGSNLQPGDGDLLRVQFGDIRGRFLTVEEKVDGSNSAISFGTDGEILLQSRGHYLDGGYGEKQFALMKQWATSHKDTFYNILGKRYIMYGEWLYAKHTVFYDALLHYFLEFDIFDREKNVFLDTDSRKRMLEGSPVVSVPVIGTGIFNSEKELLSLLGRSNYVTDDPKKSLEDVCEKAGLDFSRVLSETDVSGKMEGVYIKVEEGGKVAARLKYVRKEFSQSVENADMHWVKRPIVMNRLSVPLEKLFE